MDLSIFFFVGIPRWEINLLVIFMEHKLGQKALDSKNGLFSGLCFVSDSHVYKCLDEHYQSAVFLSAFCYMLLNDQFPSKNIVM